MKKCFRPMFEEQTMSQCLKMTIHRTEKYESQQEKFSSIKLTPVYPFQKGTNNHTKHRINSLERDLTTVLL